MKNGLTLVEVVLYLALLSLFFLLSIPVIIDFNDWDSGIRSGNKLTADIVQIRAVIEDLIEKSEIIYEPSGMNYSPSFVSVTQEGDRVKIFTEGQVLYQVGDDMPIPMNSTSTKIRLGFRRILDHDPNLLEVGITGNGINFGTTSYRLYPR